MPWLKSAKKRHRQSLKRRARNRAVKSDLKTAIKAFLTAVKAGKSADAQQCLQTCFAKLDKAGARRYIHPNAANRYKARLSKRLAATPKSA